MVEHPLEVLVHLIGHTSGSFELFVVLVSAQQLANKGHDMYYIVWGMVHIKIT